MNQSIGLRTRALGALLAGLVLGATLASAAPAPAPASAYAAALAAPGRSAQDRERDARDKPA